MPFAKVNDINMYYEIHGEGEPLIIINGAGATVEFLYPSVPVYSKDNQLIIYDHRNNGKSDKSDKPLSMELLADDAAGLLDAIDIESAHVRGMSMGGAIAQHLALRHPQRIKSLVLGCTSSQLSSTYTHAIPPTPECLEIFDTEKTRKMTPEEFGIKITRLQMTEDYENNHPALFKQMSEAIASDSQRWIQTLAEQTQVPHDTYDRLPDIHLPTLVIAGNADKMIPYQNSEIIASRIPNAELSIIDGAGHTFIEAREEADRLTLEFIKRHSQK